MNKIVNGVANDFEFDINDYNMFPPNVEKIIITKENYNILFKDLQEENMYLRDKVERLQDRIDSAIHYIEYEMPCLWEVDEIFEDMDGKDYNTWKEYDEKVLLDILRGNNE